MLLSSSPFVTLLEMNETGRKKDNSNTSSNLSSQLPSGYTRSLVIVLDDHQRNASAKS